MYADLKIWLSRRPGVFECDTERQCWKAAHEHFSGGDAGRMALEFMIAVRDCGYDVRPTRLGGYILDVKP